MPQDPFAGRYSNLRFVGRGAFGVVYCAYDSKLRRDVALKLLNADLANDPEWRTRFEQEATSASVLAHRNITVIFNQGVYEDQPYIEMEFVEGCPLSTIIAQKAPLSDPERLDLIEQLCDGLYYAHRRGIVHRDIKPVNLVVREEEEGSHVTRTLKILDFGIAKVINAAGTLTSGQLLFTPGYVSPERIRGEEAGPRSDMFAVGAVAYELLAYRKAFEIKSKSQFDLFDEVKRKIVEESHEPLASVREIDPELSAIVDRALAKDPEQRFRDLGEMRRQLMGVRRRLEAAMPAEEFGKTTVIFNVAVYAAVLQGRRAMEADDPEAALRQFQRAMDAAPNDRVREAIAEPMGQARARLAEKNRDADERAARDAMADAMELFQRGEMTSAIRRLEAFEPREMIGDRLEQFKRAAELLQDAITSVESGTPTERGRALLVLEQFPERSLVEEVLDRLRRVDADRREMERHSASAAAIVGAAEAAFEHGERGRALQLLEEFHPPHARVSETLERLRARDDELMAAEHADATAAREEQARREAAEREEQARREAAEQADRKAAARAAAAMVDARTMFIQGRRKDAIEALLTHDDRSRVEPGLQTLNFADALISKALDAVLSGPPKVRTAALRSLAEFSDTELVAGVLADLRDVHSRRGEQEALDARAGQAVRQAEAQFQNDSPGALKLLRETRVPPWQYVVLGAGVLMIVAASAARIAWNDAVGRPPNPVRGLDVDLPAPAPVAPPSVPAAGATSEPRANSTPPSSSPSPNRSTAPQASPDEVARLVQSGITAHNEGNFDEALRYYGAALKLDARNREALQGRERSLTARRALIENTIRRSLQRAKARYAGTTSLADYDAALKDLEQVLRLEPGHQEAAELAAKIRTARDAEQKRMKIR